MQAKLVATLDPSKPVIDKFVLGFFKLHLPVWGSADRAAKTLELYRQLCVKYDGLISSPGGAKMRDMFDARYPDAKISDIKKIDLILWQIRPIVEKPSRYQFLQQVP